MTTMVTNVRVFSWQCVRDRKLINTLSSVYHTHLIVADAKALVETDAVGAAGAIVRAGPGTAGSAPKLSTGLAVDLLTESRC